MHLDLVKRGNPQRTLCIALPLVMVVLLTRRFYGCLLTLLTVQIVKGGYTKRFAHLFERLILDINARGIKTTSSGISYVRTARTLRGMRHSLI